MVVAHVLDELGKVIGQVDADDGVRGTADVGPLVPFARIDDASHGLARKAHLAIVEGAIRRNQDAYACLDDNVFLVGQGVPELVERLEAV